MNKETLLTLIYIVAITFIVTMEVKLIDYLINVYVK